MTGVVYCCSLSVVEYIESKDERENNMGIKNTNKYLKNCFEYFMIIIGAVIAAFAVEEFLVPCMILDGGVVGISIIVSSLANVPLGLLTFVLNIPFY